MRKSLYALAALAVAAIMSAPAQAVTVTVTEAHALPASPDMLALEGLKLQPFAAVHEDERLRSLPDVHDLNYTNQTTLAGCLPHDEPEGRRRAIRSPMFTV